MVYAEVLVDGLIHPWIAYVADAQPNLLELSADSLPPGVTAATSEAILRSIHLLPLSYPSFRLELFDSVSADYRALVTFHTGLPAPPLKPLHSATPSQSIEGGPRAHAVCSQH